MSEDAVPVALRIPAGAKLWLGGDQPPNDWDGGVVLLRSGTIELPSNEGFDWRHHGQGVADGDSDIVAYIPRNEPTSSEVIAFLNGEGPLEGVHFGDPHPSGNAFWWRRYLPTLSKASA